MLILHWLLGNLSICLFIFDKYKQFCVNYGFTRSYFSEEEIHECPDYLSAGPNSCYFNQRITRLWQTYNISVKATNDAGSNLSHPHYVDVKEMGKSRSQVKLNLLFCSIIRKREDGIIFQHYDFLKTNLNVDRGGQQY